MMRIVCWLLVGHLWYDRTAWERHCWRCGLHQRVEFYGYANRKDRWVTVRKVEK